MFRRSFLTGLAAAPLSTPLFSAGLPWPAAAPVVGSAPLGTSPLAFGAVGDGAADDTDAMQAALDEAKRQLEPFGAEQARAVVNLGGREYLVSRPLRWPLAQGIAMCNGALKADASFPAGRYLLEFQDEGVQVTRSSTLRDLIFDGQRVQGVGCLSLVNHARTLVENCFFKRMGTYGLRSANGKGLASELIVSHCRFDEWPLGDGAPTAVTSTAVCLEHNDSVVSENVIGIAEVGIDLGGPANRTAQFNMVRGNHVYTGYRPGGAHDVGSTGIYIRSNAVHTYVSGCYLDLCGLRLDDPFNIRIVENLFLVDTRDDTFRFIRLHPSGVTGLAGVVIAHNEFCQMGSGRVAAIGVLGEGRYTGAETRWMQCDVSHNAVAGPVELQDIASLIPGANTRDHGRVQGSLALDWADKPLHTVLLGGDITSMAIANLPVGQTLELTVDTGAGGFRMTFPPGVRWSGRRVPGVSAGANRIDRFRFFRVDDQTLVGDVLSRGA